MSRIFISTFPFCRLDETPIQLLKQAGFEIIVNPLSRKLKPEEVVDLAIDCDGIVAGTEELLPLVEKSKSLKIIARVGVGLDSVPLELCKSKGIKVAYTPDAVTPAVAELTISLILDLFRKVTFADKELRLKKWSRPYGRRIGASTIGIIGFGRIGFSVARLLTSFRPTEILVHDILDCSLKIQNIVETGINIRQVSKLELLQSSDIVSLHVPRDKSTIDLICKDEFSVMKSSAYLVNTSRGGIVNEVELEKALISERIAGAALDVFEEEPYIGSLLNLANILLTQHMGSCSDDCRADMEREAVEDTIRFFKNEELRSEVLLMKS